MAHDTNTNTLLAAKVGDIFEIVESRCGIERTVRVLVCKTTTYRGVRRLRVRCADGIYTGAWVIVPTRATTPDKPGASRLVSAHRIEKH